jgi:hypothetical protein
VGGEHSPQVDDALANGFLNRAEYMFFFDSSGPSYFFFLTERGKSQE